MKRGFFTALVTIWSDSAYKKLCGEVYPSKTTWGFVYIKRNYPLNFNIYLSRWFLIDSQMLLLIALYFIFCYRNFKWWWDVYEKPSRKRKIYKRGELPLEMGWGKENNGVSIYGWYAIHLPIKIARCKQLLITIDGRLSLFWRANSHFTQLISLPLVHCVCHGELQVGRCVCQMPSPYENGRHK